MRRFYEQPGRQQGKLQHKPKAAKQLCTLTANIGLLGNHIPLSTHGFQATPRPTPPRGHGSAHSATLFETKRRSQVQTVFAHQHSCCVARAHSTPGC